jgi:hypothetical protein
VPDGGGVFMERYWILRGFCESSETVISPRMVTDWCEDTGVSLSRRERGIIYAMDKAFRSEYPKTVAHYQQVRANREKVK